MKNILVILASVLLMSGAFAQSSVKPASPASGNVASKPGRGMIDFGPCHGEIFSKCWYDELKLTPRQKLLWQIWLQAPRDFERTSQARALYEVEQPPGKYYPFTYDLASYRYIVAQDKYMLALFKSLYGSLSSQQKIMISRLWRYGRYRYHIDGEFFMIDDRDKNFEDMHSSLEITPQQESKWQTFVDTVRQQNVLLDKFGEQEDAIDQWKCTSIFDDMEQFLQSDQTRLNALQKFADTSRLLYDSFSMEQKEKHEFTLDQIVIRAHISGFIDTRMADCRAAD